MEFRIFKVNLSVTLGAEDPCVDDESIKKMLTHPTVIEQVHQGLWNEFLGVNKKKTEDLTRSRGAAERRKAQENG